MEQAFVRRRTSTGAYLCKVLVDVDRMMEGGEACEKRRQIDGARMFYRAAIKALDALLETRIVLERHERAQGLMGRLAYRELDIETAIPYLEEQCRSHEHLYGGNTVALLEAYVMLCQAYSRRKRVLEARDTAKKAAEITAKLGDYCSAYCIYAHFWVRMFEHELGNFEAAEAALVSCMALIDAHPELLSAEETAMIRGLASK